MILELVNRDNQILHQKSKKVVDFKSVKSLLANMEETLLFTGGIGLAAPQVGHNLAIFVLNIPTKPKIFINPKITSYSKEIVDLEEGCLSIPGYRAYVPRSKEVTIEYFDKFGKKKLVKATKLLGHAVQHETDHLNGILYPDLLSDKSKIYKVVPIRIVFFGTPQFGVPTLTKLISLKHSFEYEVVGVVTQSPSSPIARTAQKYDTPVIYCPPKGVSLKNPDFVKKIADLKPDLMVVASFGRILPKELLDLARLGNLNVHGSLLPKYRGASPIQTAISVGEKVSGLTIMLMNEKMDEGDLLSNAEIKIDGQDTYETYANKLSAVAPILLVNTMHAWVNKRVKPLPQDHKLATYTKILTKSDGFVELNNPPKNLGNLIRAYHPWPGVWTKMANGKTLKLLPDKKVQLEGKSPVSLDEFKRGYRDFRLDW